MKRKAFITGGARGIGAAVRAQLVEAGYEVIAPSRAELDLASPEVVRRYLADRKRWDIDVLINNAGENKINPIENISLADWERQHSVNLTSAFLFIQTLSRHMSEQGWGRIVNISSCYSFRGRAARAAYSATKAGLDALTRCAAIELGSHSVLVNSVCPGFVDTELTAKNNSPAQIAALTEKTALKRLAKPEEVARFVRFLASEENTYITGQTLIIDGGFSCQ